MTSTSAHPGETGADRRLPAQPGTAPHDVVLSGNHGDPRPPEDKHEDARLTGQAPAVAARAVAVLLYSDDVDTRAQVRLALGRRIATDLPPLEWTEVARNGPS